MRPPRRGLERKKQRCKGSRLDPQKPLIVGMLSAGLDVPPKQRRTASASLTARWRTNGLSPSVRALGDEAVEQIESAGVSELARRSVPAHG